MSEPLVVLDGSQLRPDKDAGDWLETLPGACQIHISGRDPTRCRALVTLLHGNEPSGLLAIHDWLRRQPEPPATNLALIIANQKAALTEPRFSYRHLPDERDLNRCFRPPWQDRPGRLAQSILSTLIDLAPEAVLDVHNTSGHSPAFAVSILDDARHRALAGLFTEHLVVTDLRLGALMDSAEQLFPTLTLECGGAGQQQAHQVARHALQRLAEDQELFAQQPAGTGPRVYHNPVRVELTGGARLAYGRDEGDVLLRRDIETLNLTLVQPGQALGFLRAGLNQLVARDHRGRPVLRDLLRDDNGTLTPTRPLYLFMATPHERIARSDCLFYLAPVDE